MNSRVEHTDVGAYALGLLEEPDRRAFAAHLSRCARCTAELHELSGMASVFDGLGPIEDDEEETRRPPAKAIDMLRRKGNADRRSRVGLFVTSVAASVTLVAGGVAAGFALDAGTPTASSEMGGMPDPVHSPAENLYRSGTPFTGVGVSGISGGVVLESKGWGTHAALELKGVMGPLECELIAVSTSGERRVLTGWAVPRKGYGVPGSPEPLYVHGGTAFSPNEIQRFEVVTTTGTTLLTVDT